MFWFSQGLCCLPAFLVIWSSSTFIISYIIAIFKHHIDVVFPYISDTAATPPESCIFGLMTFITACAGIATIYARYKFVEKLSEETRLVCPWLNKAALWIGMLSCLGMCIVATFQETTVPKAHDVGALLFFLSGVVYIILQSIISWRLYPYGSSICVCRTRVCIATVGALAFFPTVVCGALVNRTELHKDTEDDDYRLFLTSAICEWISAFSFIFFFLTYVDDFKLFTLKVQTECKE